MTPGSLVVLAGMVGPSVYGIPCEGGDRTVAIRVDRLDSVLGVNFTSNLNIDGDTVMFELLYACQQMIAGNVGVTELLWLPDWTVSFEQGRALVEQRNLFTSRQMWRWLRRHIVQAAGKVPAEPSPHNQQIVRMHAFETGRRIRQARTLTERQVLPVVLSQADIEFCRALAHIAVHQRELYNDTVNSHLELCDDLFERSGLPDTADSAAVDDLIWRIRVRYVSV